ncbi:MAG: hypothetical protein ABJD11_18285 [Gemmatimonadota bacterium]
MAWREITVAETRWSVSPLAERAAHASAWRLVLAFRPVPMTRRSVCAPFPLESSSRSALFAQADRLSDDAIVATLADRIG